MVGCGLPCESGKIQSLVAALDVSCCDSAHVEKVVHEPTQMGYLPIHHSADRLHNGRICPSQFQDLQRVPKRGEGITEFMSEHRHELVLSLSGVEQSICSRIPIG